MGPFRLSGSCEIAFVACLILSRRYCPCPNQDRRDFRAATSSSGRYVLLFCGYYVLIGASTFVDDFFFIIIIFLSSSVSCFIVLRPNRATGISARFLLLSYW
jgi:hypothetical protein